MFKTLFAKPKKPPNSDYKLRSYSKNLLPKILFQPLSLLISCNRVFPFSARQMHTMVLGRSGSGKSELLKLLLWNDIHHNSSVILFDPHGELATDMVSYRIFKKRYRNRLVYLSPETGNSGYLFSYNLFENKYIDLPDFQKKTFIALRAKQIVGAFETVLGELSSPQSNMLSQIMILLMSKKGTTMLDFLALLDEKKLAQYQPMIDAHWDERVRNYFNNVFSNGLKSTKESLLNRFDDILSNQYLRHILCNERSSFKLGNLLDNGKIIIINCSQGYLGEDGVKLLGGLLLSDLTAHVLNRGQENSNHRRIFCYLDEAHLFLNSRINKILTETRKYNLHLTICNQHLGQLNNSLRSAVLANCTLKVLGLSAAQDKSTMAANMSLNVKSIPELRLGRWLIGVNDRVKVVRLWDFLAFSSRQREKLRLHGDRGKLKPFFYMKLKELKQLKKEQIKKYYIAISSSEQSPKVEIQAVEIPKSNTPKYEKFEL